MVVRAGPHRLSFEGGPLLVGVVNATPDSFSDTQADRSLDGVLARARELLDDGANIIEVGGESNVSNRPPVPAEEELRRVLDPIREIAGWGVPVSVDTHKPEVAAQAVDAGASIVNDVSGLADPEMPGVVASSGAAVVLLHTEVAPKESRWDEDLYPDGVVPHVRGWLESAAGRLADGGIARESIVLDPGPDFAKTPSQTTSLVGGLADITSLGYPVMLAASRKDFVGAITDRRPSERLAGSLAAVAAGMIAGVHLLRVHDVAETRDFIKVWRAIQGDDPVPSSARLREEIRREPAADELGSGSD